MTRRSRALLAATALAIFCVAPASAGAAPSALSSRLAELSTPDVADEGAAARAQSLSLPASGPGSLVTLGERVVAEVRVSGAAAERAAALEAAGASVLVVSPDYETVTIAAAPGTLDEIGRLEGVDYVGEVLAPQVGSVAPAGGGSAAKRCRDRVISEADRQMRVKIARDEFDVAGAGTKVGVLSDSFNRAKDAPTNARRDVRDGELPGKTNPCGIRGGVQVLQDLRDRERATDEGRAMLQLVHDLAPRARLSFATAVLGQVSFAKNIRRLAETGADVIVDDIGYFDVPRYQEDVIADAVTDVTEAGVPYLSAGGNDNQIIDERNVSSWDAEAFRPTACPPGTSRNAECMDFDPGPGVDPTQTLRFKPSQLIMSLGWGEPERGVTTNFDILFLNRAGKRVAASRTNNIQSGRATDLIGFKTSQPRDFQLVIRRSGGSGTPAIGWSNIGNTQRALPDYIDAGDQFGPTVIGHPGAIAAEAVAAVPYDNAEKIETFSSRGPVTRLFEPFDPNSSAPAPALPNPLIVAKPDIAATDGAQTSFFGQEVDGKFRFYGTSAAAPHAAAVVALARSLDPSLTPEESFDALESTASPVGDFPPEAAGAGLVDAAAALGQVALGAD